MEVYGGAHLYVDGQGTELRSERIQGDDTGYIHVSPGNTLQLTGVSTYRRVNVTWAPYIYSEASFILPNATVEFRATKSLEYPSLTRSSSVDFWGRVVGNLGHLLVGFGATLTFKPSSPRLLTFVGITIQKTGRLVLESGYGNVTDRWSVHLLTDVGPLRRDGKLTVEGGGLLETRSLLIRAQALDVQYGGLINLNGKGFIAGKGSCRSVCLSVCRFVPVCWSIGRSVSLPVCLSVDQSFGLSVRLSVFFLVSLSMINCL